MSVQLLFVVLLVVMCGVLLAMAFNTRNSKKHKSPIENIDPWAFVKMNRIFGPAEYNFYRALLEHMPPEAAVFPKVRVQNIAYVSPESKLYNHYAARMGRKYVDFLICRTDDMRIVCAVEFDDNQEDPDKTKEKVHDMNRILDGAGVDIFHFAESYEYTEADFQPIIDYIAAGRY